MKKFVLFFAVFSMASLFSMDKPESCGVKRKMEEYPEVKRQKDDITLISSDGIEFIVARPVAEQSQTIKYLLEDISTQEITLSHISSANLKDLLAIMRVLHERKDESKKEIMQAFEQLSLVQQPPAALEEQEMPQYLVQFDPLYEWSQLLLAANYLDLGPSVLDFLAKKVVETARNPSDLEPAQEYIIRDLDKYIARHYYLRFGQNLSGVDPNSYGFSLQELIEHNRIDMKKLHFHENDPYGDDIINLSGLRIKDLDGFSQLISDKSKISYIDLSNNQIAHLPDNLLKGFAQLIRFDASHNILEDLPSKPFKETSITNIDLSSNRLKLLSENTFDRIPVSAFSYVIDLSSNQLTELPEQLFSKLEGLARLNLSFNKLKQLPENIFASSGKLIELDLSFNEFESLPMELFSHLSHINFIDLLGNPLMSLPDFEIPRPKILIYRDDLKLLKQMDPKKYVDEVNKMYRENKGINEVIILLSH